MFVDKTAARLSSVINYQFLLTRDLLLFGCVDRMLRGGDGEGVAEVLVKFTEWFNWILLRKLKYFICCRRDLFLFLVRHLSNSIWNTSISGVKSSRTTLYALCVSRCNGDV